MQFIVNRCMVLWLIAFAVLALALPKVFAPLSPATNYLLGGVILIMSLTMGAGELRNVLAKPTPFLAGFVIKWVTVPAAGYIAARTVYANHPLLAAGTIIDGAAPAGASSNLFAYLGHGSVGLAVSLTFVHTMMAPLLTPGITEFLASRFVSVSFLPLFVQSLEIVVLPVVLGLLIRYAVRQERIKRIEPLLPVASALMLYAVVLALFSSAAPAVYRNLSFVPVILATTSALIIINLAVGYGLARVLRFDEPSCRTIMFDTGVYNSGLGATLAAANFGAFAALPALLNAIMNLIIGAFIASLLHSRPPLDAPHPNP